MTADIITIGDELLIGQVVNTNAAWLGETLSGIGIEPARMLTVSDEIPAIQKALSTSDADVILFTGGLGPTHDDVTKVAIAEYFGQELKHDEFVMQTIVSRFEQRGRHMPESNRAVALVPEGFEVVENPIGTAPGLWYEHKDRVVVMMPGVPYEMKAIVETGILPRFKGRSGRRAIAQRTILTAGVGESTLAREIGDLEPFRQPDTRLAYLPSPRTGVRLRITALAETQESANDKLLGLIDRLHRR
ncbi:MAG: molybdopterin-binding protein, partial [Bacteroidota bacterium]